MISGQLTCLEKVVIVHGAFHVFRITKVLVTRSKPGRLRRNANGQFSRIQKTGVLSTHQTFKIFFDAFQDSSSYNLCDDRKLPIRRIQGEFPFSCPSISTAAYHRKWGVGDWRPWQDHRKTCDHIPGLSLRGIRFWNCRLLPSGFLKYNNTVRQEEEKYSLMVPGRIKQI